jgi:carbamoyl-phosphate synthase large subunit
MRGVPPTAFTLSEYLPGRDFACQSLWKDGKLVLIKTCERLSYYGGWNRASGVSSTPQLAKTVRDPRVVQVCTDAVQAIDPKASGVFSIDLKEDENGIPCVTEINVGRFFMITNIFDLTGKHNMAVTYVRLALGEPVDIGEAYDVAQDYYLVRDLDTVPGIFHAEELFEGIREVEGEEYG